MKNKLTHFIGDLFAKSIWILIALISILTIIILSPLSLLSFILNKLFYFNKYF